MTQKMIYDINWAVVVPVLSGSVLGMLSSRFGFHDSKIR